MKLQKMRKNDEQARLEAQELHQRKNGKKASSSAEEKGLQALAEIEAMASSGSDEKENQSLIDETRITSRVGEFYAKVLADVAKEPIPEDWLKRLDEIDKRERE